jgi:hypothetical protein
MDLSCSGSDALCTTGRACSGPPGFLLVVARHRIELPTRGFSQTRLQSKLSVWESFEKYAVT